MFGFDSTRLVAAAAVAGAAHSLTHSYNVCTQYARSHARQTLNSTYICEKYECISVLNAPIAACVCVFVSTCVMYMFVSSLFYIFNSIVHRLC